MSKSDYIIFLLIIWITLTSVEAIKGYKIYRNPNCTVANNCTLNETKIIQVIVKQPNKTIHFLLPGNDSRAPISVIMLEADANADQVSVNWTKFLSQSGGIASSISLKGVHTSYGFIINEFCVYIDFNDAAVITPDDISRQCLHMLGKNLIWQLIDNANGQNPVKFVYTAVRSNDTEDHFKNVTVSFLFPRSEADLPKGSSLYLTPKMGLLFEIIIDRVQTPDHGRIAPILIPFSQDPVNVKEDFLQTISLTNDYKEKLYNLHLARRKTVAKVKDTASVKVLGHTPAYMQWETVCEVLPNGHAKRGVYTAPRFLIPKRTPPKYKYSLPVAYYGDTFVQNKTDNPENTTVGARLQALVFGTPHDGFYSATKFVQWRGVLSMGEPVEIPDRRTQVRLALAIVIPLMILVTLATIAVIFVFKRRQNNQSDGSTEPLLPTNENPSVVRYAIDLPCFRGRQCLGGRLCLNRRQSLTPPASPELPRNEVNENENLDF
nr:lysosomal protein NCU G1 B [Hymenolepis microstoma]